MTTVLVTGATDGIGRQTAVDLAGRGADVIVHGRDPDRVADVVRELGGSTRGVVADFTSLAAVRSLAEDLADDPLDVLITRSGGGFSALPEGARVGEQHVGRRMSFGGIVNRIDPVAAGYRPEDAPGADARHEDFLPRSLADIGALISGGLKGILFK